MKRFFRVLGRVAMVAGPAYFGGYLAPEPVLRDVLQVPVPVPISEPVKHTAAGLAAAAAVAGLFVKRPQDVAAETAAAAPKQLEQ